MSRGQKRRVPENFPRMRYRASKRHLWTIVQLNEPPYVYVGPLGGLRCALKNCWWGPGGSPSAAFAAMRHQQCGMWPMPEGNPLDASAWLDGAQ